MVIETMFQNDKTTQIDVEQEKLPKEVLVIAQEIKIVKSLACNNVNKRNKQLKKLQKWLQLRTRSSFPFTEEDFRRIWKGLYYCMWMSDKPLVQEDLAERLGNLLHCFGGNMAICTNFFGAFLFTMCHQWFGLDQWRVDKFMMLVRRMLRHMFRELKKSQWSTEGIKLFNEHLAKTVLADQILATGLTMHFLDIFCEELAKVAEGDITSEQVGEFIHPFVEFYCTQQDCKLTSHCRTRIFYHLLYQSSLGREYMERYEAWKEMGFPTPSINDLERVRENNHNEQSEHDEIEEGNKQLDPRAGNVDVYMPELQFDVKYIINTLEPYLYKDEVNTKRRKIFKKLLEICRTYQNGEFPLGIQRMPQLKLEPREGIIANKIEQLNDMEKQLFGVGRKLKQLNKRKRRKLLKSLKFDTFDDDDYEKELEKAIPIKQPLKRKAKIYLVDEWIEDEVDADLVPKKKKNEDHANVKEIEQNIKESKNGELLKLNKKSASNIVQSDKHSNGVEEEQRSPNQITQNESEWEKTLKEGEMEYFIPSRKIQMKKANSELVLNPLAMKKKLSALSKKGSASTTNSPVTPASVKRVRIALKHNTAQNPSEYIRQVKCSPNLPYDANKKPAKGLLKPNSMPSPINPFYKKKIGLRLLNDTL